MSMSTGAPAGPKNANTPALGRKFIAELAGVERVAGAFSIANAQLGKTRNDKPYLRCLLGDKTGEMPGRMWSIDESTFRRLPTDGFVWVEGETQPYQGELQFIIHPIGPIEPTPDQMRDLLPCSKRPAAEMFAELLELINTLTHPAMKALAKAYLDDAFLMDAFRQCPAAKSMHHAYLGGLLEHTVAVATLAVEACALHVRLNSDLLITAALLHDLGKTEEFTYGAEIGLTEEGRLLGHIPLGVRLIEARAEGMDPARRAALIHCVLCHHGPDAAPGRRYGSPEALALHRLNALDASVKGALEHGLGLADGH